MSRFFNGPTTLEGITFSPGNAAPDAGPITVVILARPATASFTAWAIQGKNAGGTGLWSILADATKLYTDGDFGTGGPAHGTGWCWYAMTKASGSAIPRWHKHDLTAGTAWVHQNDTFNIGDGSGPITSIVIGNAGSAANTWRGRIAVAATFTSVLNDAAIEAACTLEAADLLAAGPGWMVRLNQASTATAVTDDTGGGGNQTAITGTSVDADDPPGFDYSLAPPPTPAEGSAALGLDLAVAATGARSSSGSAALGLGLALGTTGARSSSGAAALGLGLAVNSSGSRTAQGQAAVGLELAVSASGARPASGSAAVIIDLAPSGAGVREALGSAALGLGLNVSATGSNGQSGRPVKPWPGTVTPVSSYPWTPRPVRSFQEVDQP